MATANSSGSLRRDSAGAVAMAAELALTVGLPLLSGRASSSEP